jgi:hypothetical protein
MTLGLSVLDNARRESYHFDPAVLAVGDVPTLRARADVGEKDVGKVKVED